MGISKVAGCACLTLALLLGNALTVAAADTFTTDEFVTYAQVPWGSDPNNPGDIGNLLVQNFDSVYASSSDLLQIGLPGPGGHYIIFDSGAAVNAFLPASGPPDPPLTVDLLDPTVSSAGSFGGEVLTLALNVDFNEAGLLGSTSTVAFGDLILTGLTGDQAFLNGLTVNHVLTDANIFLGGSYQPDFNYSDFFTTINDIDMAFNGGTVSSWADEYLELPATTTTAAPEIDFASAADTAVLLIGALIVLRSRRERSSPAK